MINPTLSICIPTFNRASYLDQALRGLESAKSRFDEIEIVVSDNNSTDNTFDVCKKYSEQGFPIRYAKNFINEGAQKNIINTIKYSSGRYCAFLGDDDIFREGWVNVLLETVITRNPDVIVSDRIVCDKSMNPKFVEQCGPDNLSDNFYTIKTTEDLRKYLSKTESTSGFGFLSNLVVKRSYWNKTIDKSILNRHPFPHTLKIMDLLYNLGGALLRITIPTVFARAENDRLEELAGVDVLSNFQKSQIHFDGFLSTAEIVFADDEDLKDAFLTPIKRIFTPEYRMQYIERAVASNQEQVARQTIMRLRLRLG